MAPVRIDDVSKHAGSCKDQAHIGKAKAKDWASPVRLIVNRGPKAEEAHRSQDHCNHDKWKTELWLVDALVFLGEIDANPVIGRSRYDLAQDGQDKWRKTDEAGLADCEVVWRRDEDDPVHHREDNDPCDCIIQI